MVCDGIVGGFFFCRTGQFDCCNFSTVQFRDSDNKSFLCIFNLRILTDVPILWCPGFFFIKSAADSNRILIREHCLWKAFICNNNIICDTVAVCITDIDRIIYFISNLPFILAAFFLNRWVGCLYGCLHFICCTVFHTCLSLIFNLGVNMCFCLIQERIDILVIFTLY